MSRVPRTAMVLAAGLGQRMRPLTDDRPKPLIKVAGETLLDRVLDPAVAAGVERIVINIHWHADQIEAHMAARGDVEVVVSDERDVLLETGGGLAKARPLLGDDPILVLNTDAFWGPADPEPYRELAEAFDPEAADEILLLADRERCLGFPGAGDFFLDESRRLTRRGGAASAPWAYAGVRILKPSLYDDAPVEPFSANRMWNEALPKGRLHGLPLDRFWMHVGDPEALKDAEMWVRCHGG